MQVVGRPCDVCGERVSNELVGVACLRCERVFHDACVSAPPETPETYRTPKPPKEVAERKKKKAKAPLHTFCPTCGNDVRLLKRDRDRSDAAERERYAGDHRPSFGDGGRPNERGFAMVRFVVGLLLLLLGAYLRYLRHR